MTETSLLPLAAGFPAADDARWRVLVDTVLKGAEFRKRLVSRTADGIEVEPLYTRPASGDALFQRLHFGSQAGWRIAQLRAQTAPDAFAAAALDDAENGAEAIIVRVEAPGQIGLPADPGSIDAALRGLPLDRVQISLEAGSLAVDVGRALIAFADRRQARHCVSRLGIDPLGVLARTGELSGMSADGARFASDMSWLALPGAPLTADARPYHEAGASEAQEIAALAATLVGYLRMLEQHSITPRDALPRIALSMVADADIHLSIAKLRAARRVLARIGRACGAPEAAQRLPLTVTTSERMMARRDPWVNMLRTTAACAAAAMGGANEIAVLPHTWALGQTDAIASRTARNVGIVLREEAGLGRIMDPTGGSWAVERLTDQLSEKAWALFQEWEAEGGMFAALKSGLVHDQIAAVAEARANDIATRKIELTGVSAFPKPGPDGVVATPWPAAPPITGSPVARPLPRVRLAAPFETLRDAAERATTPPRVFLASLGSQPEHATRSMWTANLLAAGGIEAITSDGFTSSQDAGRGFAESGTRVACICGSDQSYAELGDAVAMALRGVGAEQVYLAGRPGAQADALKQAGVSGYLHAGIDVVRALARLQVELGIA